MAAAIVTARKAQRQQRRCLLQLTCGALFAARGGPLKILCIATKLPWPPVDGGRLVLWETLLALAAQGHAIRLVAPGRIADLDDATRAALRRVCTPHLVPVAARSWWRAAGSSVLRGWAMTNARHYHPSLRKAVAELVSAWRPDVVHVEQLQAFAHAKPALVAGVPVVLRMQNVESELWRQLARTRWQSRLLLLEAWRLRRDERRAISRAAQVITLTERDAQSLREIGVHAHAKVRCVAPPFPTEMPCAPRSVNASVAATLVLFGSSGWLPNAQGNRWFVGHALAQVQARTPAIEVHMYGGEEVRHPQLRWHPAPEDAVEAFPADGIAVVVLFIASGIRMRILEAWARGVPVIATSVAAAGLLVQHGDELLIANSAEAFARAVEQICVDQQLRARLVAAGRAYLRRHHSRATQSVSLSNCYEQALCAR